MTQVYADGAGYSDAIVLPDPDDPNARVLAMAFQKTFHPPNHGIEGGGYDIGIALLPLKSDDGSAHAQFTRQLFANKVIPTPSHLLDRTSPISWELKDPSTGCKPGNGTLIKKLAGGRRVEGDS